MWNEYFDEEWYKSIKYRFILQYGQDIYTDVYITILVYTCIHSILTLLLVVVCIGCMIIVILKCICYNSTNDIFNSNNNNVYHKSNWYHLISILMQIPCISQIDCHSTTTNAQNTTNIFIINNNRDTCMCDWLCSIQSFNIFNIHSIYIHFNQYYHSQWDSFIYSLVHTFIDTSSAVVTLSCCYSGCLLNML